MKNMVRYIEISALAHSTEVVSRVKEAMLNLVPQHLRAHAKVGETLLTGHYGNPIRRLQLRLEVGAEECARYIASRLSDADKRVLTATLDLRLHKSTLYIKLSKQDAYLGEVKLYEGDDSIKVVIGLRADRRPVRGILEELGFILESG